MFNLTPEQAAAIVAVLLIQVTFVIAIYGLLILRKYTLWKQEQHFIKSLDDLNKNLKDGMISLEHYKNMRYDLEKIYQNYFEKWK